MVTTRTDYSVNRAMEVTVCWCHLSLQPDSLFMSLNSDLLATVMGANSSTWQERWLHLSMLSSHDLQCVLVATRR